MVANADYAIFKK